MPIRLMECEQIQELTEIDQESAVFFGVLLFIGVRYLSLATAFVSSVFAFYFGPAVTNGLCRKGAALGLPRVRGDVCTLPTE